MSRKSSSEETAAGNAAGRVLRRTWAHSGGRNGEDYRYSAGELGPYVMRPKETRNYAPAPCSLEESESAAEREVAIARQLAKLTPDERRVHELQQVQFAEETRRCEVPVEQLQRALDEGWNLVRQESGIAHLVGEFVQKLTSGQIAAEMGISEWKLHRLVKSKNRKLNTGRRR